MEKSKGKISSLNMCSDFNMILFQESKFESWIMLPYHQCRSLIFKCVLVTIRYITWISSNKCSILLHIYTHNMNMYLYISDWNSSDNNNEKICFSCYFSWWKLFEIQLDCLIVIGWLKQSERLNRKKPTRKIIISWKKRIWWKCRKHLYETPNLHVV